MLPASAGHAPHGLASILPLHFYWEEMGFGDGPDPSHFIYNRNGYNFGPVVALMMIILAGGERLPRHLRQCIGRP